MAIKDTASEIVLENIIKDLISHGESPTTTKITNTFNSFAAAHDLSAPLFSSNEYRVLRGESSSVAKYNGANNTIRQDLLTLYRDLFYSTDQALFNFERWRNEASLLEGQLDKLTQRITNLLLLSKDTAGFFNFMEDTFVNNSLVNLSATSAFVSVQKNRVTLGTTTPGATRIDLSNIPKKSLEFSVLSKTNLVSTTTAQGTSITNSVSDMRNFWQQSVYTSKPGIVTAEFKINFGTDTSISRIEIDLHAANQGSSTQITPMYSNDNYSWSMLPVGTFTQSIADKGAFQFTPITTKWLKLVMTKTAADQVEQGAYLYEFGFDSLSFYSEGFSTLVQSTLLSKPLSVTGNDGLPELFSRATLEVCETIPTGTSINYYLAVSGSDTTPVSALNFVSIDPLNRTVATYPTILDFGDLTTIEVSGIGISEDPTTDPIQNPSLSYSYLDTSSGTPVNVTVAEARYHFLENGDRILSLSLNPLIDIAQGTLEIWRNVQSQGTTQTVRGAFLGWRFEDPYYKTTVLVKNAAGVGMDFGSKVIVIDGAATLGKTTISQGRHSVWVHKDNWKSITAVDPIVDVGTLKKADALYPYNHRFLVEGYPYPVTWPTGAEKVYRGFDIVAESFMKEVSVFDIINNVSSSDYTKFAIDKDTLSALPVFVVKVDTSQADYLNERFLLRFKAANVLYKYITLKAVLATTDAALTPVLTGYRIKVSS